VRVAAPTLLAATALVALAGLASAEPTFLSRQYARCTNCHYSATGGGLLTPYGRSLSRQELSTFGASPPSATSPGREQEFLYGALRDWTGPVRLGIELRPAHLDVSGPGYDQTRDFLMNADVQAAVTHGGWTFYGDLGRQPRSSGTEVKSFEHWIGYKSEKGFGVRAGRFLPAYGVHLADHTSFTRAPLGLDNENQVYAVELSYAGDRQLVQVSAGPGYADSVSDSSERAFTAFGRWQVDLTPRLVLVGSGLYRAASEVLPRNGATGLALGVSPWRRLTVWAEADARFQSGLDSGTAWTYLADVSLEVYRGVWLRVSPQLMTDFAGNGGGTERIAAGFNLLPRTHWNVVLMYYHDRDRTSGNTSRTLLAQLHLYL
jgi:hypothetical protein